MPAFVVQIDGYDPVAAAAVTLYASSVDDDRVCVMNAQTWWPVIAELPKLRYDLVDAGFSGRIDTPTSQLSLAVEPWPNFARYALGDARVRMWSAEPGTAWASWTLRFDGRCKAQPAISEGRATLTIGVDDGWLDTPLLTLYAGTTGLEGDAGLKGQPKPLALGAPRYCPPQLIDNVNIVFQLSAYGLIEDVEAAFEGLASFGASAGDYASYAALVAATVKAGQWATSKASGLVRHGAPPAPGRRFCYHVKGDKAGSGGWVRLPGAIIRRIAILAGGTGKTNDTNLAALDTARPWNISWDIREQITAREAIQRIAASVNAVAGVSWTSLLFVAPIPSLSGSATITLDSSGAALPPVAKVEQIEIDPPYWRMAIEAERTEDVHQYSDVAFTAVLVDRGAYDATQSYREGHIVQDQGTTWLYINPTPSIGNAPPTLPSVSNSWWKALSDPGSSIIVTSGAANFRTTDNAYNPSSQTINFSAALYNLTGTISWTAKNPAGTTVKSGTGTSFSLAQSDMGANLSLIVTATCGWASSQPIPIGVVDDSTAAAGATVGATGGVDLKQNNGTVVTDLRFLNDQIDIVSGKPTNVASGATGKTIDNSLSSMTVGGGFTNGAGGFYQLTAPGLDASIGISRMNPADNLIRNPDQPLDSAFWATFASGAGVTVPVRTAGTTAGEPAFYWTGSTTVGTCVAYPQTSIADAAAAEPGKYYRFEGLLNGSITVYMQFYDAAGNELSATGNNFTFSTSSWTPITCGRVAPANTAKIFQQFWFTSSAAKLGQPRLFAVRTDTTTSPLTPAVNRNADVKEVATDGRPAFWFVAAGGTALPTYLGWKDPTTKSIMTTTASAVVLIGSAFKLEPNTQYEVEVIWGADGGSNSGSQVVISEYDSDLPADTATLNPFTFVEVPSVVQTRTQALYTGSLADASGGSFTRQVFTYTPTSTAKWAALYLYEGFGATKRLLIKRAYVRNKATWGATSGTNIKRASGSIASGDSVLFNDQIGAASGKLTNVGASAGALTVDNSLSSMTTAGVFTNGAGGTYTLDALNVLHGPTESGSDKTANQQVTVSPYTQMAVEILTDSSGTILSTLPMSLAQPKVQKGSTDVTTTDALTTYAIANTSPGLGTVTVDNTGGSSTKGQPTIPNTMTGSGSFQLVVSYNSVEIARITITVTLKAQAPASTPPSGATGDSIAVDAAGISGTTAPGVVAHTIRSLGPVTVGAGQNLHGAFTGSYTCGSHSKTSTAIMRWQYSANNTTWTDFISGTSVTASIVATSDASFNQYPGSISCNQAPSSAPSAGAYYVRLVCYKSGTGTVSFDGTDIAYVTVS